MTKVQKVRNMLTNLLDAHALSSALSKTGNPTLFYTHTHTRMQLESTLPIPPTALTHTEIRHTCSH